MYLTISCYTTTILYIALSLHPFSDYALLYYQSSLVFLEYCMEMSNGEHINHHNEYLEKPSLEKTSSLCLIVYWIRKWEKLASWATPPCRTFLHSYVGTCGFILFNTVQIQRMKWLTAFVFLLHINIHLEVFWGHNLFGNPSTVMSLAPTRNTQKWSNIPTN